MILLLLLHDQKYIHYIMDVCAHFIFFIVGLANADYLQGWGLEI